MFTREIEKVGGGVNLKTTFQERILVKSLVQYTSHLLMNKD